MSLRAKRGNLLRIDPIGIYVKSDLFDTLIYYMWIIAEERKKVNKKFLQKVLTNRCLFANITPAGA